MGSFVTGAPLVLQQVLMLHYACMLRVGSNALHIIAQAVCAAMYHVALHRRGCFAATVAGGDHQIMPPGHLHVLAPGKSAANKHEHGRKSNTWVPVLIKQCTLNVSETLEF